MSNKKIKNRMKIKLYRNCKICNKIFYSLDYHKKYCSRECSKKARIEQQKIYHHKYYLKHKDIWNKYRSS